MSPIQRPVPTAVVPPVPAFADRLNHLFDTVRDPNGMPYTAKRISSVANAHGYTLSDAYISQLRTGKAKSPSYRTVEALARAFDVSVTHFLSNPNVDAAPAAPLDAPDADSRKPNGSARGPMTLSPETLRHITDLHGDLSVHTIDALIELLQALRAEQSRIGATSQPRSDGDYAGI